MAVKKGKKQAKKLVKKKPVKGRNVKKRPVGKKPVKRQVKRPVGKKPVKRRLKGLVGKTVSTRVVASKGVKRDLKSLRKGLKKGIRMTGKVSTRANSNARELDLLRKEVETLKRKKRKAGLSEYQKFMRKQIKAGLSFKKAASLWRKSKREDAKKGKKRTAYNVFISMQLKRGKTMKQAIATWNKLKKGSPKRKSVRVKSKALKKPVKGKKRGPVRGKPVNRRKLAGKAMKAKKKAVKRNVVRRIVKPRVVTKTVFPEEKVAGIVEEAIRRTRSLDERNVQALKEAVSGKSVPSQPCEEELALRMLSVYFAEVARYGVKRKLTLDEVINAYFYALMRVERKGIELDSIKGALTKSNL